MGLLLIWILFGAGSAIVASNKGLSGGAYFLAGILLGPIGLVLAIAAKENKEGVEKKALQQGDQRKCPFCAELIKREAVKCRFCGSEVEALPAPAPRTPEGKAQEPMPPPKFTQEDLAKRNRSMWLALGIGLGGPVVIFGVVMAVQVLFY